MFKTNQINNNTATIMTADNGKERENNNDITARAIPIIIMIINRKTRVP